MVEFSADYNARVIAARHLIKKWTVEKRTMYGITTGFGILCDQLITPEKTALLQKNVIESSAISVGEPYTIEQARAIMVMVLQNLGSSYSGIRLEVLEMYREFLNRGLTPWAPREDSVGYLCTEAHLARTLYGEGKMYYQGQLPTVDKRVSRVRPHRCQVDTAANLRKLLEGSEIIAAAQGEHLQALSLRAVPQLHGTVKKTLHDARETVEVEMNSCCDNPFVWPEEGKQAVISCCNCDDSNVGIEIDSCCIAATSLPKCRNGAIRT